jgi:hypothetical protein
MALEKAGGYYFSTGGSEMICRGDIKVKQGEIDRFGRDLEVISRDGSKEQVDVVVFATGYTGFPTRSVKPLKTICRDFQPCLGTR